MLTWSLIATIAREADDSPTQVQGGRVNGNQLIMVMSRTASKELWRSDDRGVTWTFHTFSGFPTTGPSAVFDNKYWFADSVDNRVIHTPSSNPGAGGFTLEPTGGFTPFAVEAAEGGAFLNAVDTTSDTFRRRTAASTWVSIGTADQTIREMQQIPGTGDLLTYGDPAFNDDRALRITPSNPLVIVNARVITGNKRFSVPRWASGAVSSTEYYAAADPDADPMTIYRTTNGGSSWTATNPVANFWPHDSSRRGHASGYIRYGGNTYCFITYTDTINPSNQKRVKLAKFNGVTWDIESNDTNDSFFVVHTLRGVNASGDLDFYVVTADAPTDTVRVYRATLTQLATGIITSKALAWDFRELPVHGSRWTLHRPFPVGNAITTGGRGDPERVHYVRNDTPRLVEFPSGTTDEGTAISWKWKSRAYAFGAMLWEKGIRQIAAVCLGTTGTIVVDLFEDLAAAAARTYSLVFTGAPHERKSTKRIHADVQGRVIQVQLTGTVDTFEASGLEVEPTRKRRPTNP